MDEGEIRDADDDIVKKSSAESVEAKDDGDAKRRKEDRSREIEGTKQTTVVVAASGDRPSFDIKIVTPVVSQVFREIILVYKQILVLQNRMIE